jgi:phosphoribosylanthranilate isomerase
MKYSELLRNSTVSLRRPQVKICGLMDGKEARACTELGADAIGCVFYPPSPRHVSDEQARDLFQCLPAAVCRVGVFVNESFSTIMQKVERCGLEAAQLHGQESVELVEELRGAGLLVIKAIFVKGAPSLDRAGSYRASAYLVECAGGPLPGGNALKWDWSSAAGIAARAPVILAGGLNPENVSLAIQEALPDAVDVSSGVESAPGRKDMEKVKRFLEAVTLTEYSVKRRRIFS